MSAEDAQARMMRMVQGLLSKTVANGATLAEAEAAAAKAQELAFRHNIDLLKAAEVKRGIVLDFKHQPFDLGSNHTWKRALFHGICWCNFSKGVHWTGTRKAAIVGEEHNIQVVEYLYRYLVRAITDLSNEAWHRETVGRRYTTSSQGEGEGTFKDRFGRGAATAVVNRLYGQKEAIKVATQSTALVVVRDEDVKRAFTAVYSNTRTSKGVKRSASSSWKQGVDAGNRVPLNPALRG
jgi:hypothetical protein